MAKVSIFTLAPRRTELFSSVRLLLPAASGCGENLYMSFDRKTWSAVTQVWYDEVQDWRYGVGSVNGGVVGHFTQVRSGHMTCGTLTGVSRLQL